MRRLMMLVAVLLLTGTAMASAPPVPYEETRFARVAAQLARDPLYVDMDMADYLDGPTRTAIRATMTSASSALGVPVYVVAIPNNYHSESYNKGPAFLAGLNAHVRRNGFYLTVDEDGTLAGAAYRVPRQFTSGNVVPYYLSRPGDRERRFADLTPRVDEVLNYYAKAPAGPPATAESNSETGVPPFGREVLPEDAEFWGMFFNGLLWVGLPVAGLLYWGIVLAIPPLRRAGKSSKKGRSGSSRNSITSRPMVGWLRSQADKEFKAFGKEMDRNRPEMVRALHAVQALREILHTRGKGADKATTVLDLVGLIVLCRWGRAARTQAMPVPPCFVNPLHGPSGRSRRKIPNQGKLPVCDGCATTDLKGRVLRVPDGRPHYEVTSRWHENGFGAKNPDLPAVILEPSTPASR